MGAPECGGGVQAWWAGPTPQGSPLIARDWGHVQWGRGGGVRGVREPGQGCGARRAANATVGLSEAPFCSLSMARSCALGATLRSFYFTFSFFFSKDKDQNVIMTKHTRKH